VNGVRLIYGIGLIDNLGLGPKLDLILTLLIF